MLSEIGPLKVSLQCKQQTKMDDFDDLSIEEFSHFDFVEEMTECIDAEEKFNVNDYINGNYDY